MPDDLEKYLVESQNPTGHNESDKMYPTRNQDSQQTLLSQNFDSLTNPFKTQLKVGQGSTENLQNANSFQGDSL